MRGSWEEGGPIDPGEAEYDGEQWLGESDPLAERAARVAREAVGGRGERAAARAAARKRQAEGGSGEGREKRAKGGGTGGRAGGKRKRGDETVEQRVRVLVEARWERSGGEEARLRDVWADASEEGISVREVGRVVRAMALANELMESDGALHKLM